MEEKGLISNISKIKALHEENKNNLVSVMENSIRIGELLYENKKMFEHGEWTRYLRDNKERLGFGVNMAQKYMKIYRNREMLRQKLNDIKFFGVEKLIRYISPPEKKEEKKKEEENKSHIKLIPSNDDKEMFYFYDGTFPVKQSWIYICREKFTEELIKIKVLVKYFFSFEPEPQATIHGKCYFKNINDLENGEFILQKELEYDFKFDFCSKDLFGGEIDYDYKIWEDFNYQREKRLKEICKELNVEYKVS